MHLVNYPINPYFFNNKIHKSLYVVSEVKIIDETDLYILRRIIISSCKFISSFTLYVLYSKKNKYHNYYKLLTTIGRKINISNPIFKNLKTDLFSRSNFLIEPNVNLQHYYLTRQYFIINSSFTHKDLNNIMFTNDSRYLLLDHNYYNFNSYK